MPKWRVHRLHLGERRESGVGELGRWGIFFFLSQCSRKELPAVSENEGALGLVGCEGRGERMEYSVDE